MNNRTKLLRRYLAPDVVDAWFIHRVLPSPCQVNSVARAAAVEFVSNSITYEEFSLVCMNLHFEAILRFRGEESALVEPSLSTLVRMFADPSRNDVDQIGRLKPEVQEGLLSHVVLGRAA